MWFRAAPITPVDSNYLYHLIWISLLIWNSFSLPGPLVLTIETKCSHLIFKHHIIVPSILNYTEQLFSALLSAATLVLQNIMDHLLCLLPFTMARKSNQVNGQPGPILIGSICFLLNIISNLLILTRNKSKDIVILKHASTKRPTDRAHLEESHRYPLGCH